MRELCREKVGSAPQTAPIESRRRKVDCGKRASILHEWAQWLCPFLYSRAQEGSRPQLALGLVDRAPATSHTAVGASSPLHRDRGCPIGNPKGSTSLSDL
jgi:hypothetical protein